jgi:hypothetical protein
VSLKSTLSQLKPSDAPVVVLTTSSAMESFSLFSVWV